MKILMGKLFQHRETRNVTAFEYNPACVSYYKLIQDAQKDGFQQNIITSDIMLSICEHCLIHEGFYITNIEFLVEDEELKQEIEQNIKYLKNNRAFWSQLKQRLHFLSTENSIDIKRLSLRDEKAEFQVQVNGVFSASECIYEHLSKMLITIVEEFIK